MLSGTSYYVRLPKMGPAGLAVLVLPCSPASATAKSISFLPLAGCAIGTGMVFGSLIRGISYSPEQEETMFNYAVLGFAFIETFAFMLFGAAALAVLF